MPKLRIDTSATVYEPITVEIDGQTYTLKRITRKEIKQIEALDREVSLGHLDAIYGRLEVLFGEQDAFAGLSLAEVSRIIRFVVEAIAAPETDEKNGPKPGDIPQPS